MAKTIITLVIELDTLNPNTIYFPKYDDFVKQEVVNTFDDINHWFKLPKRHRIDQNELVAKTIHDTPFTLHINHTE